MKTKILTFACMLLAGMMLYSNASIAKADEESVSTGSAIEAASDKEVKEPEDISESEDMSDIEEDEEAEDTDEVEVLEDKTPKGEAVKEKADSKKAKKEKADKKSVKTPEKTDKKSKSVINYTDEEFKILVCTTFLEAGNQSYRGKLATANSIINRVLSKKFPNTIKGVIYQKYAGRYQFTLCKPGGKLDQAMKNYGKNTGWRADYEKACIKVCKDALAGKTATDRKYHFFRLYYKGVENWKPDGVHIDDTYYYNY